MEDHKGRLASTMGDYQERLIAMIGPGRQALDLSDPQAEAIRWAIERIDLLERACSRANAEVCQTLGRALGYPRFADDQRNFPGATDEHGICVGDHVAESLASEAASSLASLRGQLEAMAAERDTLIRRYILPPSDTCPTWDVMMSEQQGLAEYDTEAEAIAHVRQATGLDAIESAPGRAAGEGETQC